VLPDSRSESASPAPDSAARVSRADDGPTRRIHCGPPRGPDWTSFDSVDTGGWV